MVKMMRPPYAYSPAREPDAWRQSDTLYSGRLLPSDPIAQLDGGRSLRRQAEAKARAPAAPMRPLRINRPAEECGVADFRSLARTIERRRQLEPLARSVDPRAATVRPPSSAASRSWINDVRLPSEPIPAQRAAPAARPLERQWQERAASVDASEIARLEGLLREVLDRLNTLEQQANNPQPRPRSSRTSGLDARNRRRDASPRRDILSERPKTESTRPEEPRRRVEEVVTTRPRRLWR